MKPGLLVAMATVSFWSVTTRPALAANELSIRVSQQFVTDRAILTTGGSSDLVQAEFNYAGRVWRPWRGELWIEGGWTIGQWRGTLHQAFDTNLVLQQLTVGARAALPIRPWMVPHLRAGLGAAVGHLGLRAGGDDVGAWSGALTGYLLAGVELLLPRPWMYARGRGRFTAGLVVEGGYALSTKLRFTARPEAPPDSLAIAQSGVDLGALSLNGPVLRIGALLRF